MSGNPPKYWGGWEGKIIKTLVLSEEKCVSWENLLKQTGLTGFQLRSALATLFDAHVITKEELETDYHLADEKLGKEYISYIDECSQNKIVEKSVIPRNALEEDVRTALKEAKMANTQLPSTQTLDLSEKISQWRNIRDLKFSLENKHFFLAGLDLDDFTKHAILEAESTILIANPCLENCYLTIVLEHVARKGLKVNVVTRPPILGEINFDKKQDCHTILRSSGVSIRDFDQIHSKVLVVDKKVAIVSSTNFYSGYGGGTSLEAGIVSFDEKVVDSVSQYIVELYEKASSKTSKKSQ
jgi:hypothetical protein